MTLIHAVTEYECSHRGCTNRLRLEGPDFYILGSQDLPHGWIQRQYRNGKPAAQFCRSCAERGEKLDPVWPDEEPSLSSSTDAGSTSRAGAT